MAKRGTCMAKGVASLHIQEEKWNLKFFLQNRPDLAAKLQKGQHDLGFRDKNGRALSKVFSWHSC